MQTYVIVAKQVTGVFYYLDFNYALTQVAILMHSCTHHKWQYSWFSLSIHITWGQRLPSNTLTSNTGSYHQKVHVEDLDHVTPCPSPMYRQITWPPVPPPCTDRSHDPLPLPHVQTDHMTPAPPPMYRQITWPPAPPLHVQTDDVWQVVFSIQALGKMVDSKFRNEAPFYHLIRYLCY